MHIVDTELPSNQKFGYFFTLVFIVIGVYSLNHSSHTLGYFFLILSIAFLFVTILKPKALLTLNKLWMRFGLLLGVMISPIVLGLIFYGIFTPISLLMKLFGRDELRLKLLNRKTYWRKRINYELQSDSFKNQF